MALEKTRIAMADSGAVPLSVKAKRRSLTPHGIAHANHRITANTGWAPFYLFVCPQGGELVAKGHCGRAVLVCETGNRARPDCQRQIGGPHFLRRGMGGAGANLHASLALAGRDACEGSAVRHCG